jgi:hypothetical protein
LESKRIDRVVIETYAILAMAYGELKENLIKSIATLLNLPYMLKEVRHCIVEGI